MNGTAPNEGKSSTVELKDTGLPPAAEMSPQLTKMSLSLLGVAGSIGEWPMVLKRRCGTQPALFQWEFTLISCHVW